MSPSHAGGIKHFVPRILIVIAAVAMMLNVNFLLGTKLPVQEVAVEDLTPYKVHEDLRARALATFIELRFKASGKVAYNAAVAALQSSRDTGLPASLILGVAAVESSLNPLADNGVDKGIMGVNPKWHPEKIARIGGAAKLFEVGPGIKVGAQVLKEYSLSRKGNVVATLLRYNGASSLNEYPGKVLAEKHRFDRVLASVSGG